MADNENWQIHFDISSGKYVTISYLKEGKKLTHFIFFNNHGKEGPPYDFTYIIRRNPVLISNPIFDVFPPMLVEIKKMKIQCLKKS